MKFAKPPLIASFCALIGISLLCTLGTWQIQRLAWKEALLNNMQTEMQKEVQSFPVTSQSIPENPETTFFLRGTAKGTFDYEREIQVGPKSHDGFFVYYVITPLLLDDGATLLVQRGWVTPEYTDLTDISAAAEGQRAWVSGYVRKPQQYSWVHKVSGIENDLESNTWQYLDIAQIAQVKNLNNVLPVVLYAENASYAEAGALWPNTQGQEMRWPNNNHLQYALFWFAMTFALALVFTLRFCIKKTP